MHFYVTDEERNLIQSFKPGEVDAKTAHLIGKRFVGGLLVVLHILCWREIIVNKGISL